MIEFDNSIIQNFAIHLIGNKTLDEGIDFSNYEVKISDDNLRNIVTNYFFSSFNGNELYKFTNDISIEHNDVFVLSNKLFSNKSLFFEISKSISKHLYKCSTHPKIKKGELYVCYIENINLKGEKLNALGIFKSENKDNYLKVSLKNDEILSYDKGINTHKLDKGCLIFDTHNEDGNLVSIIDNTNKSDEAVYWKNNFLDIEPIQNEYRQTNDFLRITKKYITEQLDNDFNIDKTDKIDLLNRSIDYFKTNEVFNKDTFEQTVLENKGLIDSFRFFDKEYRQENQIELSDSFEISQQALKKQSRAFKSVLKLDKNFHIYIHGDRNLIEKGIDDDGKKFYKIYYNEEN